MLTTACRAMYNVLRILLHRPFVVGGHLHSHSFARSSFLECATAATQLVRILQAYDKVFSIRRAPYLISYATYVSATIHVRIAARQGPGSEAHASLATCLAVFEENQETNWAVRRANLVIRNLMRRLGVVLPQKSHPDVDTDDEIRVDTETANGPRGQPEESRHSLADQTLALDIDAILETFVPGQRASGVSGELLNDASYLLDIAPPDNTAGLDAQIVQQHRRDDFPTDDMLFGFNGSALDNFFFPE